MVKKFTIRIEGYGKIKVKYPKEFTKESVSDLIAGVVKDTMKLVDPKDKPFHPVLGMNRVAPGSEKR